MLSLGWFDPVVVRALGRRIRPTLWPRSGTVTSIRDGAMFRSDTRPIGGIMAHGSWTLVVDAWFSWPRHAATAELTAGGGAAVVVNWRPSSRPPVPRNPTTVTMIADGVVGAVVETDDWPAWAGQGPDLARFGAATAGIPTSGADPRAVALTVAGRLTGAPIVAGLLTATLRRRHLE